MKPITTFSLLIISAFLTACSGETPTYNTTDDTVTISDAEAQDQSVGINGENILIYKGPGTNFDKIVNDKATEAIGRKTYCQVDYTTRVEVLKTKVDWSKIRVVKPEWLSDTTLVGFLHAI